MKSVIISIFLVLTNTINASDFIIQPHPIKFDQVPLSQTVLAGADVSFTCSAIIVDEPTLPQFIWYHNDTEIISGNVSNIGINTSALFISNVSEMDQGEYHCIIKDWKTRTKSKIGRLIVYGEGSTVRGQHLNVVFNETAVLQCNADGIEPGTIQWLWNKNATIDFMNERFYKLQDGSLVILQINGNDAGEYSCETIVDRGHVKLKSYLLIVSTNRSRAKEAVLLYPERLTHYSDNMTIVCQIPSNLQVYNVTWIRNGTIIGSATEDTEVVGYDANLLTIRRMTAILNEYKCLVYKSSSDESPAISPTLMVYKSSMPVVEHSNVMDYYICANSDSTVNFLCVNGTVQNVSLYCNGVGGFPFPTVTWYRNGDEIINATIVNGTLMLNKSACDLLGTYQCVVSNKVGSKTAVFRVLPYGWPSTPGVPKLSTEGKILYINWKKPSHLGGLNTSSINYAMWKNNFAGNKKLNEKDCMDTQCNITVSYSSLKSGGTVKYYINLTIASTSTMCQGYNLPYYVTSKQSKIRLSEINEYGPPLINLTCSDEEATVTTLPTGSLSSKELQDQNFVKNRTVHWSCTNGTKTLNSPYQDKILWVTDFNFTWTIPWRSYNCSAKVTFRYIDTVDRESMLTNCSNTKELPTEVTPSSSATTVSLATSLITKELSSLTIQSLSIMQNTTVSIVMSQTTMEPSIQSTPSSLPIEDKSHLVGTDFAAIASSLVISLILIAILIIIIGLIIKWKRERHTDSSKRTIRGSLDSIPKAYSYIGREEQSVCEKATINWINRLNETDEIESIKYDDLSNEQMLNDLYGMKATNLKLQYNNETNKDVDMMCGRSKRDGNQPMELTDDDKTEKSAHSAASTALSTDYICSSSDCSSSNRSSYKSASMEKNSDDAMNNLISSYASNSTSSSENIVVANCQNQSSELKSNVFILQYNTHGTDDAPVAQPANELLPKCALERQDPYPYVGLSCVPDAKNCSFADSDTKVILDNSSAGYIQEANLTI